MELKPCFSVCVFLFTAGVSLASSSTAANEYYVGFIKNYRGISTITLFITTAESVQVPFTVSSSTGLIYSGTATNTGARSVTLSSSFAVEDNTVRDKGVWIRATDASKELTVYGINYQTHTVDGFVALPCYDYQQENYTYYAVSTYFTRNSERLISQVLLLGCEDNTELTITPTQTIEIPADLVRGSNYPVTVTSGRSYTIILNRLQTFLLSNTLDLTGTKVVSNKPISFFSGHECADVPVRQSACDHLVEQLPPTLTWGRRFFVASLFLRTTGEEYKLITSTTTTTVVCYCYPSTGGSVSQTFMTTLNGAGSSYEFHITQNMFCSIQATSPVLLVQLAFGGSREPSGYGDPFMMMIPPMEQYSNNYTFVTQSNFENAITITVASEFFNSGNIFLNGSSLSSATWTKIYCSTQTVCGYGTRVSLSIGRNFIYHGDPIAKLGTFVYGFMRYGSYGYPAGLQLDPISGNCQPGTIQLVAGQSVDKGIVQVCLDGSWTYVCRNGWSSVDGAVTCRQLGYSFYHASTYNTSLGAGRTVPLLFSNVRCTGSETMLTNCPYDSNLGDCTLIHPAAGVTCHMYPALMVSIEVNGSLFTGNRVTFTCSIEVSIPIPSVLRHVAVWRRGTTQLSNNSRTNVSELLSTGSNLFESNLTINSIEAADSGNYTCEATLVLIATNRVVSSNSSMVSIVVEDVEPSVVVSGPLYVGRSVALTCHIMVNASAHVLREINTVAVWWKGNTILINNNHTTITGTVSNGSVYEINLTLAPLDFSDSGNYSCTVTLYSATTGNVLLTNSSTISFAVEGPSSPPRELSGYAYGPTVIGLTWSPPQAMDINGVIDYYVVEVNETHTGRSWTFQATDLHINISSLHPYYIYECQVAAFTFVQGPFTTPLQVVSGEDAPTSPPTNLTIEEFSSKFISLSWDPPPFEEQNGLIWQYVITITQNDTGMSFQQTSNTTEATIQSLQPFSTYIIAVAAETVDVGPFTAGIVVMLPEDVPRAPPLNVSGSVVNSSTIMLNWYPPDIDDQNGIVRYYVVNVTELQTENMFQFTANATSLTITSLHPAYTYKISVSAATIGPGPFSPTLSLQTDEAAPSGFPRNFSAPVVTSRFLSLIWNPPLPEDQNGVIIRYTVNISVLVTMQMFQLFTDNNSIMVSSLRPYTTYSFTIAAETAVGVGPFSGAYMVMTATDVPSAPEQPVVSRVIGSPLNLFVTWTSPSEPNGVIASYTVYCYKPTPGLGNGTQQYSGSGSEVQQPDVGDESMYVHTIVPGNETQAVVTDLEPYTTYNCYVVANTSAGAGNPSIARAATTDESVPGGPPSNFRATVVNSTTITLSWSEPLLPHGVITSYTITYNSSGTQILVTIDARDADNYLISTLNEFTVYEIFIHASTRIGPGPSASLTVTTNPSYPHAPPENVQAFVTGSTTATISWFPPPDEHQNGQILYYLLIITDHGLNTDNIIVHSTATSAMATNLQEFNNYSCIVAAATIVGLGPYSLPVRFTTQQDVPSAPPQSLTGIAVSSTVVMLTWSSPPLIHINGIIRYYVVKIMENETSLMWITEATDSHINITSLQPYHNYEFEVAAHTIATGPYTEPAAVQTMEAAPSSPPTNIAVASMSSDSFLLSWDPPPVEDINGVIRNYVTRVTEVETGGTFYVTTNITLLELNGLHPFYMYTSIIAAQTVALGPYSSSISVRLAEEAPTSAPTNISGQAVDSTSIALSWSPPPFEDQNGIIRHYIINVTEVETSATFSHVSLTTSISLYNLHPFYNYSVTVTAVTVGAGPATMIITVRTKEDAPSMPPENLTVEATTSESITLSWSPPDMQSQNGIITGYLINVTEIGTGETFQLSSVTTNLVIQSLRPFTTYVCVIAAETNGGTGPFSISLTVQTNESAPSAPPEELVAASISSTSFVLSWSPPPISQQNGIIREYRVNITEIQTGLSIILNSTSTSVSALSLHPYYTYECTVSAYTVGGGPYSEVFTVTTSEDVPSGYPQTIEARAVSSRMSTLSWDPPNYEDRNGIIIGYVINVTNTRRSETLQYTSNTTTLTLSTLSPYTTYYCIVAARTSVGTGPFSAVYTLQTHPDVPSSPPQTPHGNALSSTGITLFWDPPPTDEQNGIITRYVISITEVETDRSFSLFSATTSVNVTSLHPYYTYNCTIAAVTIVGEGPYTRTITIVTFQDVPSGPPQNITPQASSARSLYITWNPPAAAEQNGIITSYTVNITGVETREQLQLLSESESANVTGLTPHTTYLCIVAASTAIGPGPFSIQKAIRTPEAVPGSHPSNTTGTTLNSTHIYLMWEPPEDPNGDIREYRVNVTEEETGRMFQLITSTTSITIGSLHPYYTYNCTVVAVTIGPGPFSTVITVRTAEDAPSGSPSNFQARALDSKSIHLSWDPLPLAQRNGIIRNYRVTILNIAGEVRAINTTATSVNIAALNPFTMYTCTVAAETIAVGPSTSPVEIVTPPDVPSGPPQGVEAQSENPTTLVLSWQPPAPENQNGIIVHYIVNITEMETGRLLSFTAVNTTTLSVPMLHPFYTYTCIVAAVTVGIGPYSATVEVELPEDAPSSSPVMLTFSNITDSSFSLVWQDPPPEDQNGIIRIYFINITEEETGREFQLTSSAPHILVEFLHPSYTYVCAVAALTVAIGPYSPPLIVTTLEAAPSSPPVNINVSSLNSSALIVTWEPPMAADRNGAITGYFVNVTNVENGIAVQLFTSSTALIVDSLEPFTVYNITIAAQTAVGAGPYSIDLFTKTKEDAPSGPPVGVSHLEVTSTSVTLSWNPPETSQQNGVIRSYSVIVREEETGRNFSVNSTNTELSIGNLHPFYTYHFTVAAVTISQGPFTNEYVLQTLEDVPSGIPQSIQAQPIDSRSLLLAWEPPLAEEQNGVIQEYLINISVAETGDEFQYRSPNTTLIVEDLHPHYTYSLVISAVTISPGPYSEMYTVQMPEDAPTAPPENLTLQVIGSSAVVVFWRLPPFEEQNGVIKSYTIVLVELPTNTTLIYQREGNHTELTVEELHPYYEYRCSIAAQTQIGTGPFSDSVTVRTAEDVPTSAPVHLQGNAVNSTTIHLQWEPPPLADQNGVIRSYHANISVAETGSILRLTSQTNVLNISGLHPYYTYSLSVAAVTIGPGPYGFVLNITMPEDVPTAPPENFTLKVLGPRAVLVTWRPPAFEEQNGVIIAYTIVLIELNFNTTLTYQQEGNYTELTVDELQPYYEYNCSMFAATQVGNGPFTDSVTIRTFEDVPTASPENFTLKVLGPRTVLVTWRPPTFEEQNGVIITYSIVFVEVTSNTTLMYQQEGNYTELTVDELHPYYEYNCSMFAATQVGNGPFTDSVTIRTFEDVPTAPPENFTLKVLGPRAVLVTWRPPAFEEQNGVIINYSIVFVEVTSNTTLMYQQEGNYTELNVDELHPYYEYNCSMFAATQVGNGPFTDSVTIRTFEDVPTASPENFTLKVLGPRAVLVSWRPPAFEEQNGIIINYSIVFVEVSSNTALMYQLEGNYTELTVDELHPYYEYNCSMFAATQVGNGPFTDSVTIRTFEDVPTAPPENFTLKVLGPRAVLVTWRPPAFEEQNGVIINYSIVFVEVTSNTTLMYQQEGNYTELTVDELQPYYEYNCSMFAATQVGNGPFTDSVTIRTFEDVPTAPPENFTLKVLGPRAVLVSWRPPAFEEQNGVIITYSIVFVEVSSNTTLMYQQEGNYTELTVDELHPYYEYNCSMFAATQVGNGRFTDSVTIRTFEDVPSAPQNITGEQLNATAVRLQWDPPESPNGIITGYQVTYYGYRMTVQVQQVQDEMIVEGPHDEHTVENSMTLTDLSPGLSYTFKVRARTSVGYGENSTAWDITLSTKGQPGGQSANASTTAAVTIVIFVVTVTVVIVVVLIMGVYCRKKFKYREFTLRNIFSNTIELIRGFPNKAALEDEEDNGFPSESFPEKSDLEGEERDDKRSTTSFL